MVGYPVAMTDVTVTVADVLSAHADALNQGMDHTAWLVAQYGARNAAIDTQTQQPLPLADLLYLARRVQKILAPQTARSGFSPTLRHALVQEGQTVRVTSPAAPPAERSRWLMGLLFLFSLVAGWLGWQYWRRTPPPSTLWH
jgi:hypothetical protein